LIVTVVGLLKDSILIVSCLVLLFTQIKWLSFVTLACIILHARVVGKMQASMWEESLGRSPKSRMMNYIASLSVNPAYAKEIRLFPIGDYLFEQYKSLFYNIYASMLSFRKKQLIWPMLSCAVSLLSNLVALYYLVHLIIAGDLKAGAIALLIQSLGSLHHGALSFGEQIGWMAGHLLFFDKYFAFLKKEERVYKPALVGYKSKVLKIKDINDIKITFDKVSFKYNDGRKALEDISFSINSKDKLAIVGANGAGKSTLIKLLCGFYAPTSGQIMINDVPIGEYDLSTVRSLISPVFQDFGAYALTVRENITMGKGTVPEGALEKVVKKIDIDFVDSLPNKLESKLGKEFGGTDLSIGQWQKIAIARALYKEALLLILDEPTASLDPISEGKIFEYFAQACADKTTIFVTHRLTSVKLANKILLLDKGEQKGLGTHEELLSKEPIYKKMFEIQASKYIELLNSNK
jgi:ATP-binding cassette subfamily B protein